MISLPSIIARMFASATPLMLGGVGGVFGERAGISNIGLDGTMLFGAFHASLPAGLELPFVLGAASASILWFSGITTLITLFSAKFNDKVLRWINIVCGCVIIFYGLKLLYNFVQMVMGM